MADLCEMPIGESGRDYILSVFDRIPGLCAEMAPAVRRQGDCYAVLPAGTALTRAQDFDAGGVMMDQRSTQWLEQRIAHPGAKGSSGVVLVQDVWAKPRDYIRHPPKADVWIHDEEIYLWAEFGDDRTPTAGQLIRSVKNFMFAGFVVSNPNLARALKTAEGSVEKIAPDVTEIFVPAYDHESFVIWAR